MTPHRFSLAVALPTIAMASLMIVSDARGQTTFWQLAGSGSWFDSDNWTLGVPSSTRNAEINNGGAAEIFSAAGDARIVYLGRNLNTSGTLNVVNGVLDSVSAYVGHTGSGTASVQGTNSNWTMGGDLRVGYQGTGQLNATSGGRVNSNRGLIGDLGGATGVATVYGTGSKWTNAGELFVGNQGTGTLNVQSGGLVVSNRGLIGDQAGSTGVATVNGAGSKWTINDELDISLSVGKLGTGTLNIQNGGMVSADRARIGDSSAYPGAKGTVIVDGANSKLAIHSITVGLSGVGEMRIQNGGTVSNIDGYGVGIGIDPGSNGTVTVDGAGSTWTTEALYPEGGILVGSDGTGILNITNGGTVSSQGADIGRARYNPELTIGIVTIDGAGSVLTVLGDKFFNELVVGLSGGKGELKIQNGGSLITTVSAHIGYLDGVGTVTVDGPGSTWTNEGQLFLGEDYASSFDGTGTLSVQNGGVVSAVGGVSIGPHGTTRGNGTIIANVTNYGVVAPGTSPGTLHIDGNYTENAGSILRIELASAGSYDKLDVFDNAAFGGTLEVSLIGGYAPLAGSSFNILDWGSISSGFGQLALPQLGGSLTWDLNQLYATGVISVVSTGLAGDFNKDGFVDAADYVVWRKGPSTTYTPALYNEWRANFGATLGAGSTETLSANSTVPEPSGFALMVVAVLAAVSWIREKAGGRDRRLAH